jgi:TetR/AcrR family transcriptional repressor of nem operon
MSASLPTRSRILGTARDIIQARGYGRLHYAEVSQTVGIQGPTIHYYFPHKADLGVAVLADYRAELAAKLAAIDRESATAEKKIARYIDLYTAVLDEDEEHMCPGGMLAAEVVSLPPDLQAEVREFFADNERWLAGVLAELEGGSAVPAAELTVKARRLLSALQGALLIARLYRDRERFLEVAASWKSVLGPVE